MNKSKRSESLSLPFVIARSRLLVFLGLSRGPGGGAGRDLQGHELWGAPIGEARPEEKGRRDRR